MIGNFVKKIFAKPEKKPKDGSGLAIELREKSAKIFDFVGKNLENAQDEIASIKVKFDNLQEANYNLGIKHLENGHLADAIFRFRFIKKFWPHMLEAQYQLAYCLVLNNEAQKAKEVLRELLLQNPNFDPKAHELLDHINAALNNPNLNAKS